MPSQGHGRVCLVIAVCLVILFFVLKFQYYADSRGEFTKQHSRYSTKSVIGNDTLGFEKILVINAPWRTDRKDAFSIAASYSGLSVEWIDGVAVDDIVEKAYPPGDHRSVPDGNKGSWRAHMNALRAIIHQNLTTALIMEDDADWDFRLRSQLESFSHASRALPSILAEADRQSTSSQPATQSSEDKSLSQFELAKRSSIPMFSLQHHTIPKANPYGLDWDIMWLGHCGAELPPASPTHPNRISIPSDPTVPLPKYLKPMPRGRLDTLSRVYPPHTRLIHRANSTLCTLAYAVTQSGARRLLYEFGIREFNKGYDFALSDYCNGLTRGATRDTMPMCLTVQPPLFAHHFNERAKSDITGKTAGWIDVVETRYVRWSVRMNLERLVRGEEGLVEQWVDEEDVGRET